MEERKIQVNMLGECSISLDDIRIDCGSSRSRRIWLLLAYLICNRDRFISQDELISRLLEQDKSSNPTGALKTSLWRARTLLESFHAHGGHEWIIRRESSYKWNPPFPTEVDAEQFDLLCKSAAAEVDKAAKLSKLRSAVRLYRGDFLEKFSGAVWAEPIAAYHYNLYISTVSEALSLMEPSTQAQEILELCSSVLKTAPYHEVFYQYLMQALMAQQEYKKAEAVYCEMRELLFSSLGILPDERSQAIHEEILAHLSNQFLTVGMLREQLRENDPPAGAFFCDFSVFKMFYRAEARSALRRGDTVHVVMMTVTGADGRELSELRLKKCMEQLRNKIQSGLRRGDIVSRCSNTQFAVLLLQANYENSQKVCHRIVRSFVYAYPHSPARIQCTVLPLEPIQEHFPYNDTPAEEKRSWNTPST